MTNRAVSNRADLRERTITMSRHRDRPGQIVDFRDCFEKINWLYLLFKWGLKRKKHFEWLLWHWSWLTDQLNLEPTRPNGFVGCKVPTELVKISVKEATHMFFYHNTLSFGHYCHTICFVLAIECGRYRNHAVSVPSLPNWKSDFTNVIEQALNKKLHPKVDHWSRFQSIPSFSIQCHDNIDISKTQLVRCILAIFSIVAFAHHSDLIHYIMGAV